MTQYVRHIPTGDIYVFSDALMKRGDCELVAGDPFVSVEAPKPPPESVPEEPPQEQPEVPEASFLDTVLEDYTSGKTIKPRRGRPPSKG